MNTDEPRCLLCRAEKPAVVVKFETTQSELFGYEPGRNVFVSFCLCDTCNREKDAHAKGAALMMLKSRMSTSGAKLPEGAVMQ